MQHYADAMDFVCWCIGILLAGVGIDAVLYRVRHWRIAINIYPNRGKTGQTERLGALPQVEQAQSPGAAAALPLAPTVRVDEAYTGQTERIEVQ